MELEITIKVPLGPTGAAVQQQTTGMPASLAPVEPVHAPPPIHLVEAMTSGNGGGQATAEFGEGGDAPEIVHEPPSPAEFGIIPTPSADDAGPPPLDVLERIAATSTEPTDGPPGLEGVPVDELVAAQASATPPDLPDISQVPPAGDEFAPPPIEDVPPAAAQKSTRQGSGKTTRAT